MERPKTTLDRAEAERLTVAEVMLRRPKSLPSGATVGELRAMFDKPTLRTILLVDGETFVATVERDDLPDEAGDREPARSYARLDAERVRPDAAMTEVLPQLDRSRHGRLVVVDEDGATLRGMLCMRSTRDAFCVDGQGIL